MKKKTKVEIVLGLNSPAILDNKKLNENERIGILELLSISNKLEFDINDYGKFKVEITLLSDYNRRKTPLHPHALKFQIDVPDFFEKYTNTFFEYNDRNLFQIESIKDLYKEDIANMFQDNLFYFLLLGNIAKPGYLQTQGGDIFIDGEKGGFFNSTYSLHREGLELVKKMNWPTYKELKYLDVWEWYLKSNFSFYRHSQKKEERAFNAFTHLFKDYGKETIFDLFWALIGIEALYCINREGISEQIFQKTQILFGPLINYKKKLKKMYNFRSRMVHGDLDFGPRGFYSDSDEITQFEDDLLEVTCLAIAILTATFQYLITNDKDELFFNYTVK